MPLSSVSYLQQILLVILLAIAIAILVTLTLDFIQATINHFIQVCHES
ncbi:MAG: hypothetical protein WBF90_32075 [Rivularia sp. (in: cyanobacteria)]